MNTSCSCSMLVATLLVFAFTKTTTTAFAPPQTFISSSSSSSTSSHTQSFHALSMAAKDKKGFGKSNASTKPTPASKKEQSISNTNTPESKPSTTTYATAPAPGTDALSRLRRQKAEERNEELRRIRDLKSVDKILKEEPDAAVIPEPVAQRMGKRMLPFVGIPLFGLMGTFVAFWYFATYKNYEFQPALVAFSSIGVLVFALLGITYSVMSASWDVEVEGSMLGFEEFGKNLGSIRDGLKRTRENAILREKMSTVREDEIDRAIEDLDKRDAAEKKRNMDLKSKLDKDLE